MEPKRRVVVTGLGLITPCGTGVEKSWAGLVAGKSGIGPIGLFDASALPVRIAGEVRDFRAEEFIERRELRRMDRFQHLALAAGGMAVADASFRTDPGNAARGATIVRSGIGGIPPPGGPPPQAPGEGADPPNPLLLPPRLGRPPPRASSRSFPLQGA